MVFRLKALIMQGSKVVLIRIINSTPCIGMNGLRQGIVLEERIGGRSATIDTTFRIYLMGKSIKSNNM